ncbi:MAG: LamG-like jellyroll fold domain-containing protein [Rhodothermales bacterium]
MRHTDGPFHNFYPEGVAFSQGTVRVAGKTLDGIADLQISLHSGDSAWNDGHNIGFSLRPNGSDNPGLSMTTGAGIELASAQNAGFGIGQWIEIEVEVTGAAIILSIDGVIRLESLVPSDLSSGRVRLGAVSSGLFDDLCVISADTDTVDLTDGLVAHYPLDGSATDNTSSMNHGIVSGAVETTNRFGKANSALAFDGDDFVEIPSTTAISFTEPFAVSAWVSVSSFVTGQAIEQHPVISKINADGWAGGYELMALGGAQGPAFAAASKIGNQNIFAVSDPTVATDTWVHVMATYDGRGMAVYLNGIPQTMREELRSGSVGTSSNALVLGRRSGGGIYWFHGSIDDVRLYNRALSNLDAYELYRLGGAATLTVSSATCQPEGPVSIHIFSSDLSSLGVAGYQFSVNFNPAIVTLDGTITGGTLSSEMIVETNTSKPGELRIAAAGSAQIIGGGTLITLSGTCKTQTGSPSLVELSAASFSESEISLELNAGTIDVVGFGDASGDGVVNVSDAVSILRAVTGANPILSCPTCADVNGDQQVSLTDAVLVLRHIVGTISCFPVESGCSGEPFLLPDLTEPSLTIRNSTGHISIDINPMGAQSFLLEMTTDGDAVIGFDGLNALRSRGWLIEEYAIEGVARLAILAPDAIQESISVSAVIVSGDTTNTGIASVLITEGGRSNVTGVGIEQEALRLFVWVAPFIEPLQGRGRGLPDGSRWHLQIAACCGSPGS